MDEPMAECAQAAGNMTPSYGLTGISAEDIAAQREYAAQQQAEYQARERRDYLLRVRSAAIEAAIRCLGSGYPGAEASDWQNVIKAARDIAAFLEE